MKTKILLILSCLSAFSCAPMSNKTAKVFVDLPQPMSNQFLQDLEATQGEAFLHDEEAEKILSMTTWDFGPNATVLGQAKHDGAVCRITISKAINYNTSPGLFRHVLYHEIGHCFGLGHSNNPQDIMAAYYSPPDPGAYARFYEQLRGARNE